MATTAKAAAVAPAVTELHASASARAEDLTALHEVAGDGQDGARAGGDAGEVREGDVSGPADTSLVASRRSSVREQLQSGWEPEEVEQPVYDTDDFDRFHLDEEVSRAHAKSVLWIAVSSNERLLASCGADETARIWFLDGFDPYQELRGHNGWVLQVCFSPNDKHVLTCSSRFIYVWAVDSGMCLIRVEAHAESVHGIAWGPPANSDAWKRVQREDQTGNAVPPSNTAAAGGKFGAVQAPTEAEKHAIVAAAPMIASAAGDRHVRIWKADDLLLCAQRGSGTGRSGMDPVAVDGVRAWSLPKGGEDLARQASAVHTLEYAHRGGALRVEFHPWNANLLLSCGKDGAILLWAAVQGVALAKWEAYSDHCLGISWCPDGSCFASCGQDGTVCLWGLDANRALYRLRRHERPVYKIAFSPAASAVAGRMLTCGHERQLVLWDVASGTAARVLDGGVERAWTLCAILLRDGRLVTATSDSKRSIITWDPCTHTETRGMFNTTDADKPIFRDPSKHELDMSAQELEFSRSHSRRLVSHHASSSMRLAAGATRPLVRLAVTCWDNFVVSVSAWCRSSVTEIRRRTSRVAAIDAEVVEEERSTLST